MTRERLEQYQSNKAEIKELKYRLTHLGEDDSLIGNDVVHDYRRGYPVPHSIVGYDYSAKEKREKRYRDQIARLEAEQDNIEEWVFAIPDGKIRRIFQLYFLEGMTQERVGRKMHADQSWVSRKIEEFLNPHKNHKNT